jgi:hypothetical protein
MGTTQNHQQGQSKTQGNEKGNQNKNMLAGID